MNTRKQTGPLTHRQVGDILEAWHGAKKAGMPLTTMLTQRPPAIDALSSPERMAILHCTIKAYCEFARRSRFSAAYVWVREIALAGYGEHFHFLFHVPAGQMARFRALANARRPYPETKVTFTRERLSRLRDGRWTNHAAYVAKQMTPQARFKFALIRQPGGRVDGKRLGMSRNLKALIWPG